MLELESAFIEERYTSFEQQKEPAVTDTGETDKHSSRSTVSENGILDPKPTKKKKRKLIGKDFSNTEKDKITDLNEAKETAAINKKEIKKQKKVKSTSCTSKNSKKKDNHDDDKKQNTGTILITCSGAEGDDSSLESDCNTSDVSDTVVNEGINNKEDIEGISEKSDQTSDARIDEFEFDYVPPPTLEHSVNQRETLLGIQHSMLEAIQDQFGFISTAIRDIQGKQTFILDRL